MSSPSDRLGEITMQYEALKEDRRLAAMEALEIETKKALERRAEIARCRAMFEEAYRSGKIYAINYIYRVAGWNFPPDKTGQCKRGYRVQRQKRHLSGSDRDITPCGVMVAVREGDHLAFGMSALDLVDKWNKYIGLEMALQRAVVIGTKWSRDTPARRIFTSFIAEQRERLRGDIAKRDHGDRRGIVTTTARGDTRVEMPVMRPGDYMFMGNIGYHHDPPAQPSPIIAVEPEPAIIKPGKRLDDDALKITATGSVYREVKK